MSDASAIPLVRRSSLEGVALPTGAGFALEPAPAMSRFILRGGEDVRAGAGAAFGAEPPPGARAGRRGRGPGRLVARARRMAAASPRPPTARRFSLRSRRRWRDGRTASSTSRIASSASSPAAPMRRARSRPAARSIFASAPFPAAWRRAPCSTRPKSFCGGDPRSRSTSRFGALSPPISSPRSPRPRSARRIGEP